MRRGRRRAAFQLGLSIAATVMVMAMVVVVVMVMVMVMVMATATATATANQTQPSAETVEQHPSTWLVERKGKEKKSNEKIYEPKGLT
ncbi:hypothetical protein PMIN06_004203 [Paraphaeosphaeria minitans]